MMTVWKKWALLLLLPLMCLPLFADVGVALSPPASPTLHVQVENVHVTINGAMAANDVAKWYPLTVKDARGQIIFFTDVPGGGKEFAYVFTIPTWAAQGKATVTAYGQSGVVQQDFPITRTTPPPPSDGKKKIGVTLSIVGYEGDDILPKTAFRVTKGRSVLDLLAYAADEKDFTFVYADPDGNRKDVYIKSIDGLAEFDKGPGSGWVYKVNSKGPPMSVDRYILEEGDEVEFLYTSDFGRSERVNPDEDTASKYYDVSDDVAFQKAFAMLDDAEDADDILQVTESLLVDLASIDESKKRDFTADVATFLQAAYEQAAMMQPLTENLTATDVGDSLREQTKVRDGLAKQLASSTLYTHLLGNLYPVVVLPYAKNSDVNKWQVVVKVDAWQKLREAKAKLVLLTDQVRSEFTPTATVLSGDAVTLALRSYSDQEQTAQMQDWQLSGGESPVPLTSSFRIEMSQPNVAQTTLALPVMGSLEGRWPVLYRREQVGKPWEAVIAPVQVETKQNRLRVAGITQTGDITVIGTTHAFADVYALPPEMNGAKEAIGALAAMGMVKGMEPTTFGLDQQVTRAQILAMLARLQPAKQATSTGTDKEGNEISFIDVPENSWYAPVIAEAVARGWTSGRSATQFAPNDTVSRAELALLLTRVYPMAMQTSGDAAEGQLPFTDRREIPTWAKQSVLVATSREWLTGRTDGRFDPHTGINRAEASVALYRFYKDMMNGT